MLPTIFGESATQEAERQSNYLILRTLEQRLPSGLFAQVLAEVSQKSENDPQKTSSERAMVLPQRVCWDGGKVECTFNDLKVSQRNLDDAYLPRVLLTVQELQKIQQCRASQVSIQQSLSKILNRNIDQNCKKTKNLAIQRRSKIGSQLQPSRKTLQKVQVADYARMKTVFCHADFTTDEVSSIFNVQFDQTGRFVVSGADDGVIKVWDTETLTLQASLHGHFDYITDIDISKCNRFIASSGKDAQIIIWDLKLGKIVKKFNKHTQLINRIQFMAPKLKSLAPAPSQEKGSSSTTMQTSVNELQTQFKQLSIDNQNFGPEIFQVQNQFLLSCSDDGTVRLYDFSPLSRVDPNANQDQKTDAVSQESEDLRIRRSNRRPNDPRSNGPVDPYADVNIFELELTPDDFRPGQRNKKLDTLGCSSQGLVVAGTNTGELFVWKVYFNEVQKQNTFNASKFLGQFKIQKHGGIQYIEFSPKSDLLLIGSTDGTVRILDLTLPSNRKSEDIALKKFTLAENSRLHVNISEVKGCQKFNSLKFYNEEGEEEEQISIVEKSPEQYPNLGPKKPEVFVKSTCDAVKWSVYGRYAIASITSKLEKPSDALPEEPNEEICRIKIWDTVDEQFYDDLAKPSGFLIKRNSWVLAPHPKFEEILLTGSDGGQLILWNIKTKQLLQTFKQYGVYSIDQYVMDNPLDGKFSKDGNSFIVGQQLGTLSLFSNKGNSHQYEATRVQQFFPYDVEKNQENRFEKMQNHPQLCGYNMIPYEVQPAKSWIGKFAQHRMNEERQQLKSIEQKAQESHEFERNLLVAKELGQMEEKYYQDQIQMCIQQDLFVPGVLEDSHVHGRLESIAMSSLDIGDQDFQMNSVRDDSVYDYMPYNASPQVARLQATQNNIARPMASPQQQNRRPRLQRSQLQDRQEVVDSNDDSSVEIQTNNQIDSQFEEDEFSESDEDEDMSDEESKFQARRQNVPDRFSRQQNRQMQRAAQRTRPQRNIVIDSDDSSPGEPRRNVRSRRRQDSSGLDSDDKEVINTGRAHQTSRSRAQRVMNQPQMQHPNGASRRRLFRNQNNDDSEESDQVNRRNQRRRKPSSSSSESSGNRNTRNTRRKAETKDFTMKDDESDNSIPDEIKAGSYYLSDKERLESESEDEDEVTIFKAKELEAATTQAQSQQTDRDYKFVSDKTTLPNAIIFNQVCAFCIRSDEPLIGPFCKFDESKDSQKVNGQALFFHRDCIEINNFSKFSQQEKTWVNIGTALLYLVNKYPQECYRCQSKGATIPCVSCKRWFHGFKCVEQYCIKLDNLSYECLHCRNKENYHEYIAARDCGKKSNLSQHEQVVQTTIKNYLKEIQLLEREHLFCIRNPISLEHDSARALTYSPQVGDLVYYFFQGHEDFITQYSCHFFSGLKTKFPERRFMPWRTKAKEPLRKERFVLCKIQEVDSLFPSKREMSLMKLFGTDSTSVNQTPQIIQRFKLQIMGLAGSNAKQCIMNSEKNPHTFTVDIFPNELPDFLILQPLFEQRLKWYFELRKQSGDGIVGKTLKVQTKKGIRTVRITKEFDPVEPLCNQSLWKNIKCTDAFASRGGRSSVTEMPQHRSRNLNDSNIEETRISFWEIMFNEEMQQKQKLETSLSAFNGDQQSKLENALTSFLQQKSEFLYIFRERVKEADAPDYKSIIAGEMYFDLIMQRIKNGYYRSQEEIENNLDSIADNATLYNGNENVIAQNAIKLCETFKMRIKSMVFQKSSDLLEDHVQSALQIVKQAQTEMVADQIHKKPVQIDFKQVEPSKENSKVNLEILQSEEEEKKNHYKKTAGRPIKMTRVITNSSDNENKPMLKPKRNESDVQISEVVINLEEQPKHRERSSSRLTMSANAQSQAVSAPAMSEHFAAPQTRIPTRKRMRNDADTPSIEKVSPSPTRPINEQQEAHIRNGQTRMLRKRQRVE